MTQSDDVIQNDHELAVTRKRVAIFEGIVEELRKTARPEEWPAMSSGYLCEIERMQREIRDYLGRPIPEERRTTPA